jgi:hypothetical protein
VQSVSNGVPIEVEQMCFGEKYSASKVTFLNFWDLSITRLNKRAKVSESGNVLDDQPNTCEVMLRRDV